MLRDSFNITLNLLERAIISTNNHILGNDIEVRTFQNFRDISQLRDNSTNLAAIADSQLDYLPDETFISMRESIGSIIRESSHLLSIYNTQTPIT